MKYEQVPNIITNKDLDYLSDMFNWNYNALKSNINAINEVENQEIKLLLENSVNVFKESINDILNILSNGGLNG